MQIPLSVISEDCRHQATGLIFVGSYGYRQTRTVVISSAFVAVALLGQLFSHPKQCKIVFALHSPHLQR